MDKKKLPAVLFVLVAIGITTLVVRFTFQGQFMSINEQNERDKLSLYSELIAGRLSALPEDGDIAAEADRLYSMIKEDEPLCCRVYMAGNGALSMVYSSDGSGSAELALDYYSSRLAQGGYSGGLEDSYYGGWIKGAAVIGRVAVSPTDASPSDISSAGLSHSDAGDALASVSSDAAADAAALIGGAGFVEMLIYPDGYNELNDSIGVAILVGFASLAVALMLYIVISLIKAKKRAREEQQ